MKKLMMGLMMALFATAEAGVMIEGFEYAFDTEAKTATIVGYDKEEPPTALDVGTVEHDGDSYKVTSVDAEVFQRCSSLTFVSLPEAVSIQEHAFHGCSSLTNALFPVATSVKTCALCECGALTSVSLPSAVTIENFAFEQCSQLKSISLPEATTLGTRAFGDCASLTNAFLPKVVTIGQSAFDSCKLISLDLPSVARIEMYGFGACQKLSAISIPAVTSVGEAAFLNYAALDAIFTNAEMVDEFRRRRSFYGIDKCVSILTLTKEQVEQATLKVSYFSTIGGEDVREEGYRLACAAYGLTPKERPQVVQEGEVAVTKESIRAAKAMTVQIVNGQIELSVSVLSNADITASTENWAPVKFAEGTQIGLAADGTKLVLPIPVAAQSGFIILQSGDAKVVP